MTDERPFVAPSVKDAAGSPTETGTAPGRITLLYRHRFSDEARRVKGEVWRAIVETFFQRWIAPTDSVLDLGCGYGEFLNHVRCARRVGVDLNPDATQQLHRDIEFHAGDIRSLSFLPDAYVNVVFTSNVLEHLSSKRDVESVLLEARRVLKPGGHLIAMGPNVRIVPSAYWDFWDHHVPISDRSLSELLDSMGFEIVRCWPRFLPYTTKSSLPKAAFLVRLYLRMPFVWPLFGQQFLIRARKP